MGESPQLGLCQEAIQQAVNEVSDSRVPTSVADCVIRAQNAIDRQGRLDTSIAAREAHKQLVDARNATDDIRVRKSLAIAIREVEKLGALPEADLRLAPGVRR